MLFITSLSTHCNHNDKIYQCSTIFHRLSACTSLSLTIATAKKGGMMAMARPMSKLVVREPPRAMLFTERLGHMSDVTLMGDDEGASRPSNVLLTILITTGRDTQAESLYSAVYATCYNTHSAIYCKMHNYRHVPIVHYITLVLTHGCTT